MGKINTNTTKNSRRQFEVLVFYSNDNGSELHLSKWIWKKIMAFKLQVVFVAFHARDMAMYIYIYIW